MHILNEISRLVESIEMHVSLMSKYENRVMLATYTAILLVCVATQSSIQPQSDPPPSTKADLDY